jgi:hypothetical protein
MRFRRLRVLVFAYFDAELGNNSCLEGKGYLFLVKYLVDLVWPDVDIHQVNVPRQNLHLQLVLVESE